VRVDRNGIRAKVGIDATVPLEEKARFARCEFLDVAIDAASISTDPALIRKYLGR
jgi:2,5-furandicarboxylate decarboxylase 1